MLLFVCHCYTVAQTSGVILLVVMAEHSARYIDDVPSQLPDWCTKPLSLHEAVIWLTLRTASDN